jgi:hypothetical protein
MLQSALARVPNGRGGTRRRERGGGGEGRKALRVAGFIKHALASFVGGKGEEMWGGAARTRPWSSDEESSEGESEVDQVSATSSSMHAVMQQVGDMMRAERVSAVCGRDVEGVGMKQQVWWSNCGLCASKQGKG